MRQSWKRIGVILLIVIMGLNLYGCFTPKRTASQIEAALEAKYGEEFRVINMGGRNGGNMDVITAHCCPVANEDVVFQARLDSNGNLVSDGYGISYVTNEVEQYVANLFSENGLDAQINFGCLGKEAGELSNLDLTDEDLLTTAFGYDVFFGGNIAVRDTGSMEDMAAIIYRIVNEVMVDNNPARMRFGIFIVGDADYDACVEEMRKYDSVSELFFRNYDTKGLVSVWINKEENEGINMTEEEILQKLEEEVNEFYR